MTDPRFDPAFQRGYSGPDPELVVREKPSAEPVEQGPDADAAVAPPLFIAVERPARSRSEPDALPDAFPEPSSRFAVHNPFRLALLLVGLGLLIAAASVLYSEVQQPQASNTTAEAQFAQLLVYFLPPALLLVGFGCVILWLALGALDRIDPDLDSHTDPDPDLDLDPESTPDRSAS
jgi:hypothetical protein